MKHGLRPSTAVNSFLPRLVVDIHSRRIAAVQNLPEGKGRAELTPLHRWSHGVESNWHTAWQRGKDGFAGQD